MVHGARAVILATTAALLLAASNNAPTPKRDALPAPSGFVFTTFDVPGASSTVTARSINTSGVVVGYYADAQNHQHGFIRNANGAFTFFDVPGATDTFLTGINDVGQMSGYWIDSSGNNANAFLRNADGTLVPRVIPGASWVTAEGLNNLGQVVGTYQGFGVIFDAAGNFSLFNVPPYIATSPRGVSTSATGINDFGQIAGTYGVNSLGIVMTGAYYRDASGNYFAVGNTSTSLSGSPGINDSGQIAIGLGWVVDANGNGAYFKVPGADTVTAGGISNTGSVTGAYTTLSTFHGYVGTPCVATITSTSATFGAAGGNGQIQVTAPAGCTWTAHFNNPDIAYFSFSGSDTGTGSGTVSYVVQASQANSQRQATINVAGQIFTITQAGAPCSPSLSLTSAGIPAAGGTSGFGVTAPAGCAWTAVSNNPDWLIVTNGASGNGNGTVSFTAVANTGTATRTGTISVGGQTFYVNQAAAPPVAQISSPLPGSTLTGSSVTFSWTTGIGALQYWLDVGNNPGQADFSTGATTANSRTVNGLPCDGRTLYVSLYTYLSGAADWQRPPQQYTYKAAANCGTAAVAQISFPTPGSTLTGSSVTFSWTTGIGALQYWLDVGNSPGQADFSTGATTAISRTVNGLPCDGRTLYVSLYTYLSGAADWQRPPQQYTYKAAANCGTAAVAQISSPLPASTLTGGSVTFSWTTGIGALQYWLDVGNSPGQADFSTGATTAISRTVNGLPCDGRTLYVSLYTYLSGAADWQRPPQQYTYKAAANCGTAAVAQISFPTPGSTLTGSSVTFSWTTGIGALQYWLDVGNSPGQADFSTGATTATSRTVNGLPCDGRTLYVSLYTYLSGAADWQRPPQQYTYKAAANCGTAAVAQISSPLPASTLTGGSVTFSWTTGIGALQYWLDVGNNPGQADFSTGATAATSRTVNGLPCDGRTLYVSLYTYLNGTADWQRPPQQYTYKAASTCPAQISSPTPGSALTGSSVTFSWTTGIGALQYWLDVGNSPGQADFSTGATTATSRTVNGLPCDGRTLYVSLYTYLSGAADWQRPPQQYTYTACGAQLPDLVVTSFTAPRQGTIGGNLSGMQMVVKNQGAAFVGPFRIGFYFSSSPNVTTFSIFTGGYCANTDGLTAGSTWTCSGAIGIPSISPGTYYLGAIVDDLSQVTESDESNNVRLNDSGTVTLTF